jgi:WD40 repeat protein
VTTAGRLHVRHLIKQQARALLTKTVIHPIRIHTTQTLWCSAPCPTGDKALFAIGTSDGLYTLEGLGSHWTLSQKPFPHQPRNETLGFRRYGNSSHASVQAVEWLSSDVIASGLRNSTVFLYDVRTRDSSLRLQHSQSVTKIRKVDPWRIVAGGHNTVSQPNYIRRLCYPAHTKSG